MTVAINPCCDERLSEVANDPIVIDSSKAGLSVEAYGNCWSFSVSQEQARSLTTGQIIEFLSAVQQARQRQVLMRFGNTHPMRFYCWHDEQASQLCFSLVSASHNCLPFGCVVKEVRELSVVVNEFLGSLYHDGIPMEEFVPLESTDLPEIDEPNRFVLNVWSKSLPSFSRSRTY